jgi:hypothetical protein
MNFEAHNNNQLSDQKVEPVSNVTLLHTSISNVIQRVDSTFQIQNIILFYILGSQKSTFIVFCRRKTCL